MSKKAIALKNLYNRNRITLNGLKQAVTDNTITEEEFQTITGEIYFAS